MGKLYLDKTTIEDSIIPKINTAVEYLNSAIYDVGTLKIPNDFEYAQYLKQIGNKNYNSMSSLCSKRDAVEEHIKGYCKSENENLDNFSEIADLEISVRNNFIKE